MLLEVDSLVGSFANNMGSVAKKILCEISAVVCYRSVKLQASRSCHSGSPIANNTLYSWRLTQATRQNASRGIAFRSLASRLNFFKVAKLTRLV